MNYQLIMLPNPIVVSDEKVTGLRWIVDFRNKMNGFIHQCSETYPNTHTIIAGIEGLPKLDLSLIADEIGWFDVEKLAQEKYTMEEGNWQMNSVTSERRRSFIEGFKAAQSLNEKKYSEEDMMLCWDSAQSWREDKNTWEKFIQSISKPKEYNVELEMEDKIALDGHTVIGKEPTITNNSITVTKIL